MRSAYPPRAALSASTFARSASRSSALSFATRDCLTDLSRRISIRSRSRRAFCLALATLALPCLPLSAFGGLPLLCEAESEVPSLLWAATPAVAGAETASTLRAVIPATVSRTWFLFIETSFVPAGPLAGYDLGSAAAGTRVGGTAQRRLNTSSTAASLPGGGRRKS